MKLLKKYDDFVQTRNVQYFHYKGYVTTCAISYEPRCEKTCVLHILQSWLISAFSFAVMYISRASRVSKS